ncbi:hypothetical protein SteCoe_26526 [Stentor coeruleus]|uniref:Uncharacterized protein n=1 Tax=Stentor coeruleus TaxID=5963 RepID=A0A1R2BCN8_9CILI|nr:hypothetical protein SteCoe_26526 [Stentor coeruleus]
MEQNYPMATDKPTVKQVQRNDSKVLAQFDTKRKSSPQAPKKEYVRCKLIRGHKRAVRQILSNLIPKTTIHKFNATDIKAHSLWLLIQQIVSRNLSTFQGLSKTESGPITDGRAKRTNESMKKCEKSFNAAFCRAYFANNDVRESFCHYLNLIFVEFDPVILSQKFEFSCCRNQKHTVDCLQKWSDLQRYLKTDMLKELDCEPFEISSDYVTLPDFNTFSNFEILDFADSDNLILTH